MKKNVKKILIFIGVTIFVLSPIATLTVRAEDKIISTPVIVPIVTSLHNECRIADDSTQFDFWMSFVADANYFGTCGAGNVGMPLYGFEYPDHACITLPASISYNGSTLYLHDNGALYNAAVPLWHSYTSTIWYGFGSTAYGTGYVRWGTTRGSADAWTIPVSYGQATTPGGSMHPISATGSMVGQRYDYRGIHTTTTHYSPLVDNKTPSPPSSSIGDNTGSIDSLIGTQSVDLGTPVDTSLQYIVTGGYHGRTLTYVSGSSTNTTDTYTATRTISGISNITDGITYNGIGSEDIAWSVKDYEADITNFTERIIVTTTGSPDINIYFPGGTTPYDNRWMSIDPSADANRQGGLDVQASSTINGNYDLSTFISGSKEQTNAVDKASTNPNPVTNDVIPGWSIANSTTAGVPATSQAFLLDDPTSISGVSAEKKMYFDSTKPMISTVTTTDNWATITTDAQDEANGSGIGGAGTYDTGDVFFKFVPQGTVPTTPVGNDNGWTSISQYELPTSGGPYDLYVYAKDNATNRSDAIKANDDPIVVIKTATITIKKEVVGTKGDADDVFLINLNDNSTNKLITSVVLKEDETSSALTLDMGSATSKTIKVSEIIPMDYDGTKVKVTVTNKAGSNASVSGDIITISLGADVTIVVENTFKPTGYFKAKDFVKNIFK